MWFLSRLTTIRARNTSGNRDTLAQLLSYSSKEGPNLVFGPIGLSGTFFVSHLLRNYGIIPQNEHDYNPRPNQSQSQKIPGTTSK